MKNIYLIVGPSGVGKTTATEYLSKKYGLKTVSSYTDRSKRFPDETGHIFVSTEEFQNLQDLVAYTFYKGYHYGVPASMVDENDLYVIDVDGVKYMQEHYHGSKGIKVINLTADPTELGCRMKKRGDSDEQITQRLAYDSKVFQNVSDISDYCIHADGIEETAESIYEFIRYHEKLDFFNCLRLIEAAEKAKILNKDPNNSNNILVWCEKTETAQEGWYSINAHDVARDLLGDFAAQQMLVSELKDTGINFTSVDLY